MVRLKERLQIIADNIEGAETMADIGSDHGFLPLYLWQNKICPKMIITDISAGSLSKARENLRESDHDGAFDFRLGDGFDAIEAGEIEVAVIAGMGGVLIADILGKYPEKTISVKKFILQPRNGMGKLRFWLERAGFEVVSEYLAEEGKFICEIIIATPPSERFAQIDLSEEYEENIAYEIPKKLVSGQEKIYRSYLKNKLTIETKILDDIISGNSSDEIKAKNIKSRIKFLNNLLNKG